MKKFNLVFVLSVFFVFCLGFGGISQAATFSWHASGFHSQSDAYAKNGGGAVDDPFVDTDWGENQAESYLSAQVTGVTVEGGGYGNSLISGDFLSVQVEGWALGDSQSTSVDAWAYGNANTVQPAVTDGIYFRIDPTGGEQTGDPVSVHFLWLAEAITGMTGTANITGGYTDYLAVTMNDVGGPTPVNQVWSHANIVISERTEYEDREEGMFLASIGDIVGIHLGVGADIHLTGEGPDGSYAWSTMDLTVNAVPVPAGVWLLGSALIGIVGFRRKIQKSL